MGEGERKGETERETGREKDRDTQREVETVHRRGSGVGELFEAMGICWQILLKGFEGLKK